MTILIGENGSGKSTLMEAISRCWTGTFRGAQDALWSGGGGRSDTDLGEHLTWTGMRPQPYGGCFLRAETMHATFEVADAHRVRANDVELNALSHGQSFLRYIADRPVGVGLWLMDEPEAALSFRSCLALMSVMTDLVAEGSQVVMATHSPLLAAFPGANVLEAGEDGLTAMESAETDLARDWGMFFDSPEGYLRHL